jgi:hypothetical protein
MYLRLLLCHLIVMSAFSAIDWKPVTPEILALKAPKIDPKADAEAIFWEVWVEDTTQGGYPVHRQENYVRIKLFNARAVEKWGDVEVPYFAEFNMTIADFKGRVIKPNGNVIDVKGNQVKESVKAKSKTINLRQKSFAFPNLEPGDIIEYQYTEVISERLLRYLKLPMQLSVPVWEVTYNVKPISRDLISESMKAYPFNYQASNWEPVKQIGTRQGFVSTGAKNMAAFVEEPSMPSEDDVKAWMMIYYSENGQEKPDKYWPSLGRKLRDTFNHDVKINGEIKALAAQVTAGKNTIQEKAEALSIYCQSEIKNVNYRAAGVTNEIADNYYKKLRKDTYNSGDTLKNKIGDSSDVRALFFALAEAAGLQPVWMAVGTSDGALFRADFMDSYMLRNRLIGIPDGQSLRFYNPGVPYLPPGMADYDEQGQPALVCDAKNPRLMTVPATAPEFSHLERTANLKLDAEGAISGNVKVRHFGHFAVTEKRRLDEKSPAEREELIRKEYERQYAGAKITNLKIENADVPLGIFSVAFDIAMEGYGQRTGKRLFFQPAFFNLGENPLFTASTRVHPVAFSNAYYENDVITLEMPEGYTLEQPEMPGKIELGGAGAYTQTAGLSKDKPVLTISRKLTWGSNGNLYYDRKVYGPVKQAWDLIHKYNTHQLTLRAQ